MTILSLKCRSHLDATRTIALQMPIRTRLTEIKQFLFPSCYSALKMLRLLPGGSESAELQIEAGEKT
jgi:hypothetical protein